MFIERFKVKVDLGSKLEINGNREHFWQQNGFRLRLANRPNPKQQARNEDEGAGKIPENVIVQDGIVEQGKAREEEKADGKQTLRRCRFDFIVAHKEKRMAIARAIANSKARSAFKIANCQRGFPTAQE
jgi:hypothetical protein